MRLGWRYQLFGVMQISNEETGFPWPTLEIAIQCLLGITELPAYCVLIAIVFQLGRRAGKRPLDVASNAM